MNPEVVNSINHYFTLWLYFASVPTIAVVTLIIVTYISYKQNKERNKRQPFNHLFK